MTIRPFRPADHKALLRITTACFDEASSVDRNIELRFGRIGGRDWTWRKARQVEADIAANPAGIFVAEVDGIPIGYVSTRIDAEARVGGIANLAVLAGHQGQGIGRRLLETALDYCRAQGVELVRIETLATNVAGQHLYPALGFTEVARQIHYAMPLDGRAGNR